MTPTNWAEIAGAGVVLAIILLNLKNMHELTGASPKRTGQAPTEVVWRRIKQDGEFVHPGDVIAGTSANDVDVEIQAHYQGTLNWIAPIGEAVPSGSTIATIDDDLESHPVIVPQEYFLV